MGMSIPRPQLKLWFSAIGTLKHEAYRDYLVFLLFTGLRAGETRYLKWCHVDFENQILLHDHRRTFVSMILNDCETSYLQASQFSFAIELRLLRS